VGWIAAATLAARGPAGAATPGPSPAIQLRKTKGGFAPPAGNGLVTVLALGSDARPGEKIEGERSDSIHLITINPAKRAGTILGFPRDSYVDIPGHGRSKINDAMVLGGPQLVVQTLQQLTGIHADYYLLTSFRKFETMVSDIGGLDIQVLYPMHDRYSGADFEPGPHHLDGGQALSFARDRHDVPGGDIGRSENQGRLLLAALTKLRGIFADDPGLLLRWIAIGTRGVATDLGLQDLVKLGLAATGVSPASVRNVVVPNSLGFVGSASVVFIAPSANALFADIRSDGILNG